MQIGSFSLIKELNTSLILRTIRDKKNISRADIAKLTGLTPATVTNITAELLNHKIILETKLGKSNGGRKPVLLEFNSSEYNVIGVVIAKHKITVSLTDLECELISQKSRKISSDITPENAIDIIITSIADILKCASKTVLGIGISMEGLIDEKNGVCVMCSNFGWENIDVKSKIVKRFSLPVFVNNDVKALALGEKFFGSAKNCSDFVLLYTGYGIGASLVNNGHIYRGASNYALEIGHSTLDINGPLCSCGNKGCFQAMASGSALINAVIEKGYDKKYFNDEQITTDRIIEKVKEGNKDLEELVKKIAHYIGIGLANIVNIFNPPLIIVNGFICKTDENITNEILSQVRKNSLKNMINDVSIIFSKLENNEAYKGAIALFVSEFIENPEMFF